MGGLLALSLASTSLLRVLSNIELPTGVTLDGGLLWDIALIIPFFFSFVLFALAFRFIPNAAVRWGDVWPGAAVAAVGFEAGKFIFGWYVQNLGNYNLVYGSLGTIIVLLLWSYISASILLFGAELSSQYAQLKREK